MRILWLSNKNLSTQETGRTGTWLDAMASGLIATNQLELCNLSMGAVKAPTRQDAGRIQQWIVPAAQLCRNGLPPQQVIDGILDIVKSISPELIHVWGTEIYSGLLTARGLVRAPAVLEIQGLKEPYARAYAGGLTVREQRACIGL